MMKKKIFKQIIGLCFLIGITGCVNKDTSKVVIKGELPKEIKKVILMERKGMIRTLQHCEITTPGIFTVEIAVKHPTNLLLTSVGGDNKYDQELFVSGGDVIKFKCSDGKIEQIGDHKEENTFLRQLRHKQLENQRNRPNMMDEIHFQKTVLEERDRLLLWLGEQKTLSSDFLNLQKEWICYDTWNTLLDLPKNRKLFLRDETPLADSYWNFLNQIEFNAPIAHWVSFGVDVAEKALIAQERYRGVSQGDQLTDYLKSRAERIGNPHLREEFIVNALQVELFAFNQNLDKIIQQVKTEVISPAGQEQLKTIDSSYQKQRKEFAHLTKGNVAPQITGVNRVGDSLNLNAFRGNVVLIDVWGTKCVPCIEEIPYMQQLEHHFKGKPVNFISIAMEENAERWLAFLDQREMKGDQYIDQSMFNGTFCKNYHIRSIPRFILIDQKGVIVEAFAPRPSDPRLRLMIKQLLDE